MCNASCSLDAIFSIRRADFEQPNYAYISSVFHASRFSKLSEFKRVAYGQQIPLKNAGHRKNSHVLQPFPQILWPDDSILCIPPRCFTPPPSSMSSSASEALGIAFAALGRLILAGQVLLCYCTAPADPRRYLCFSSSKYVVKGEINAQHHTHLRCSFLPTTLFLPPTAF